MMVEEKKRSDQHIKRIEEEEFVEKVDRVVIHYLCTILVSFAVSAIVTLALIRIF